MQTELSVHMKPIVLVVLAPTRNLCQEWGAWKALVAPLTVWPLNRTSRVWNDTGKATWKKDTKTSSYLFVLGIKFMFNMKYHSSIWYGSKLQCGKLIKLNLMILWISSLLLVFCFLFFLHQWWPYLYVNNGF
jgi:hypothetical protein